ncbi:MAG: hypothetical protein Q8N63_05720, partial [Nanoarchaeota archaeon]|nr:hypothetical protein [Nanoarchaeota archaeon]
VGTQQWKAELNDSLLNAYFQNDTSGFLTTNTLVKGDILLDFVTPDGSANYTQEGIIAFLGATTDDCGDALQSTVIYNANTTANGFACTDTTLVGANAFTCNYPTTTSTTPGYYNTTMYANYSNHYNNFTQKTNTPGLFYLNPLRRLAGLDVTPDSGLYTVANWQFNVTATSGDSTPMRIELHLKASGGDFLNCNVTNFPANPCLNVTTTNCTNCQNQNISWMKNFSSAETGSWFYKVVMINIATGVAEQSTAGTDNFLVNAPTAQQINFFNINQTPSTAQWGGTTVNWNVTVNTTITNNNLTVYLWNSLSTDGPWTQIGNRTWNNETGGNQNFSFSKLTNSSDIGTNYYKFNATDG